MYDSATRFIQTLVTVGAKTSSQVRRSNRRNDHDSVVLIHSSFTGC